MKRPHKSTSNVRVHTIETDGVTMPEPDIYLCVCIDIDLARIRNEIAKSNQKLENEEVCCLLPASIIHAIN